MCFHNSCRTEFFCAFSIIGSGGGGGIPVQYQVPHSSGDGLRPSQSAGMMQPPPGSVLFNQGPVPYQSGLSRGIDPSVTVMSQMQHAPPEAAGFQSTLDSVDDTTLGRYICRDCSHIFVSFQTFFL